MSKKLFVGRLPYSTTDEELEEFFSTIGKVVSAKVIMDKFTGQGKGFGFVEMSTEEEARKAVEELNNKELGGRSIVVNEAREQQR
jgi:RNA recognition motif-containing protein